MYSLKGTHVGSSLGPVLVVALAFLGGTQMALWRVEQAAEYLGIRPKTLYEWVRLDRVPYRKIGFNVRFDPDELERWASEQARGGGRRQRAPAKGKTGPKAAKPDAAKRGASELPRLAAEAADLLRRLEREVGTSLSYPQRRELSTLAERLEESARAEAGS